MKTKSERTKMDFADALEDLLKTKPKARPTVKQLAEKICVDRQTFYYHFESIDELVHFTLQRKFDQILSEESAVLDFRQHLTNIVHIVGRNKEFFRSVLHLVGRWTIFEALYPDAERFVKERVRIFFEGAPIGGKTAEHAIQYHIIANLTMLEAWVRGLSDIDSEDELIDFLYDSCTWYLTGLKSASA